MPRAQPYEACLLRKTLLGVCDAFLPHERLLTLQISAGAHVQIIEDNIGAVEYKLDRVYVTDVFSSGQQYLGDESWRFVCLTYFSS